MNEAYKAPEGKEGIEEPKIVLKFFRHDEKENDKTKSDTDIRLSWTGVEHAGALAEEGDKTNSVVFGSGRIRTAETGLHILSGKQENYFQLMDYEDTLALADEDLGFGSKLGIDKRLDFVLPPKGPYYDEMMLAFKEGRLLKYLVEESDRKAEEMGGGKDLMSYSSQASKIAEIVAKYLKIMPRWEQIVNDEEKDVKPIMERILVSHQSVTESFLAKVVELTKGVAERDALVSALGNQGFGFAEGFNAEIVRGDNGEEQVRVTFKKEKDGQVIFEFDELVSRDVVENMIMKE